MGDLFQQFIRGTESNTLSDIRDYAPVIFIVANGNTIFHRYVIFFTYMLQRIGFAK
jgi:hypothetical protein